MDTVSAAAEAMLADLELSPMTKATYRTGLKVFLRYLHHAAADDSLSRIAEDTLLGFSRWLREAYPDPHGGALTRTAHTYLVAARRLLNWLDLRDLLPPGVSFDRLVRLTEAGRGRSRRGYAQRPVDPQVMRVLAHYLHQPLPKRPQARLLLLRNRVLMALLYDTGMRIGEALALTREDVMDGRARKVRLTHTKNGKPRTVFLSADTRQLIAAYIRERVRYEPPHDLGAPLFASHGRGGSGSRNRRPRAIGRSQAWRIVKWAAIREGLYANTSPHSLRHRRAQDLLDAGMPLEWVAALLGHEHPDTTRVVYAWQTDENRLAELLARYGREPSSAAISVEH